MTENAKRNIEMSICNKTGNSYGISEYLLHKHGYDGVDSPLDISIAISMYKKYCWDVLRLDEITNKSLSHKLFAFATSEGLDGLSVLKCIMLIKDAINLYYPKFTLSCIKEMGDDIVSTINEAKDQKGLEVLFEVAKISNYLAISHINGDCKNTLIENIMKNTELGAMK